MGCPIFFALEINRAWKARWRALELGKLGFKFPFCSDCLWLWAGSFTCGTHRLVRFSTWTTLLPAAGCLGSAALQDGMGKEYKHICFLDCRFSSLIQKIGSWLDCLQLKTTSLFFSQVLVMIALSIMGSLISERMWNNRFKHWEWLT